MIERGYLLQRRAMAMGIVVALQALAAAFFLADAAGDVARSGIGPHLALEGVTALALCAGVVFGALLLRDLIERARADAPAVAAARGALAQLIGERFARWRLTPAEADVALFALKGCGIGEIAELRHAAAGTVRAQLARVYAKAGVGSQAALISLFLDEIIDPATLRATSGALAATAPNAG